MTRTLPDLLIEPVVRMALAEDLGRTGDVTAQACIPEDARMNAVFAARQAGVMARLARQVGAPGWTRTSDRQIRRLLLYPLS